VILEPNTITIKIFGIPYRRIPVSKIKLFCTVGNGAEDVLCFSSYCVDELAQIQEERLLRSFLNKHNVPFRKRKANWKDSFAREYLNHLRRKQFFPFGKQEIVMLNMHAALQYAISQMYPHLLYKNYTEINSSYVAKYRMFSPNYGGLSKKGTLYAPSSLYAYNVRLEPDGIHISNKKKEVSFIPAQRIQTVVRVDIFKPYEKNHPHHVPLLFVACMPEERLAKYTISNGYAGFHLYSTADNALFAMTTATYLASHWNIHKTDYCIFFYTRV